MVATYTGVVQLDGMVFDEATDYGVCFLVNASSAFLVEQVRVRVRVRVGVRLRVRVRVRVRVSWTRRARGSLGKG